ncbi:hypothetical protein KIN20_030966 [Parelaphostrongylus tenuis]|uniref:Uncharacterized protein n=1 Tax=Parelaphostrongylus tenuis TaxID=148309 RepID=A0AAD5R4W9_PARTN|nr:hypothetical protein KIN20_030966 [Parelaphostrongylus tenuis]
MMLSESIERGGPTGLLLHAIGKNGGVAGTGSSCSTINGTTARQISVTVDGFTLPVNLAWSFQATIAAARAMAVQSFVQRLTMQAVIDAPEEQSRRGGLFSAVISSILDQLMFEPI